MTERLVVVVGPTAVGKTELALGLAERIGGEIISADSMQVYRGMDIGTAKPSAADCLRVRHHLVDVVDPGTPFSVAEYQRLARLAISEITGRGRMPMLVGGTGLYVRAVIDNYNFIETETNWQLRDALRQRATECGLEALHAELAAVDPPAAARINRGDERRIIRALEVYQTTGKPLSHWEQQTLAEEPRYDLKMIGLTRSREQLYHRIEQRIDAMIRGGLLQEAKHLLDQGLSDNFTANQAIGYKELFAYLRGEEQLEEALSRLKQTTRHYAKRQLTWFRADSRIHWFDVGANQSSEELLEEIAQLLAVDWRIG